MTICTYNRLPLFGNIQDDTMITNDFGKTVQSCWDEIPQHFPAVELDAFVIMPNHLHGILVITTNSASAVAATSPVSIVAASHDSPLHESPYDNLSQHKTHAQRGQNPIPSVQS